MVLESTLPCLRKQGSQPYSRDCLSSRLRASALLDTIEILSAQGISEQCGECFYLKKKVEEEECKPQVLSPTYGVDFPKSHPCPHSPSIIDVFSGQKAQIHQSKALLSLGLIHLHSKKDPWFVDQM